VARNDLHASYHDKHKKRSEISGKSLAHQALLNRTSRKTGALFLFSTDWLVPARTARQEVAERNWKNDHDPSSFVSAANIAWRDRKKRRCATRDRFARARWRLRSIFATRAKSALNYCRSSPARNSRERRTERGKRDRERKSEVASAVDCRGYFRMYIIDIINSMLLLYVVTSELVEIS